MSKLPKGFYTPHVEVVENVTSTQALQQTYQAVQQQHTGSASRATNTRAFAELNQYYVRKRIVQGRG